MEKDFGADPSMVKHVGMVCDTAYILEKNYRRAEFPGDDAYNTNFTHLRMPKHINRPGVGHFL